MVVCLGLKKLYEVCEKLTGIGVRKLMGCALNTARRYILWNFGLYENQHTSHSPLPFRS